MRKMLCIIWHEYKMQVRRPATWGVLLAAIGATLLDSFPSALNLTRLELLPQPDYFIYRIISVDGLILVFGLMFLLSNRLSVDVNTGMKPLFMASLVTRGQYTGGKLLAGFLYAFSAIAIYLVVNTIIYGAFNPVEFDMANYLIPLIRTIFIGGLPISCFISCAVTLPVVMDIRLFYFALAGVFVVNTVTVGSSDQMPLYLVTSGDLMKLIWQHPEFPFNDIWSSVANIVFLIGCCLVSWIVLLCKRKFWRAE